VNLKKISQIIVLAALLILAVPVTAQLPSCSETVLTATDRCPDEISYLEWTDTTGATGYNICWDSPLPFCIDVQHTNSIDATFVESQNFHIIPYNADGNLCISNVVHVTFPVVCNGAPVPEFPSMLLPATMIIGFLGVVLFIQRTREN
jgi:hypothetical protein